MAMEVGKNRLEALGDVEESADLIRYYCHQMEANDGFALPMGRLVETEATSDVMRPYGVWAVISPFNFPMALAAGTARRRARRRQHRGAQALGAGRVHRAHDRGGHARGGRAEGRAARGHRPGRDGRRRARGRPARRRAHVHRLVRDRHAGLPFVRDRVPEAGDLRDGRQEPGDRRGRGRHRRRGRRHAAFGVRSPGAEVLGRVARVRRPLDLQRVRHRARRAHPRDQHRQPARPRRLPRPGDRRSAVARFEAAVEEARRTGQVFVGGHRIVDGDLARGNYLGADRRRGSATARSGRPSCSYP